MLQHWTIHFIFILVKEDQWNHALGLSVTTSSHLSGNYSVVPMCLDVQQSASGTLKRDTRSFRRIFDACDTGKAQANVAAVQISQGVYHSDLLVWSIMC